MSSLNVPGLWRSLWDWLGRVPDRHAFQAALAGWALIAMIVVTIVAIDPLGRSATIEYQNAASNWSQGKNLYEGKNKYLYLPQHAIIYTPFYFLPKRVGEPLWRLVCLGTLGFALWAAARQLAPEKAGTIFLLATVLTLPSALASARNGQVNMPLAGIYLLTAVALARNRWHLAAILLAISLALKPISIVPILLCAALFPRTILPLILWLGVMFALAFIHQDFQYVTGQYREFFEKLTGSAAKPKGHTWNDFAGMLRTFHLSLPDSVNFLIRAGAAILTFAACLVATLRTADPLRRAFTVLLFAVIYLMLFNPRTEANSYVILGIWIGLLGAYAGLVQKNLRTAAIWTLFALALGTENYGWPIYPFTNLWLKALVTLAFGIWLAVRVVRMPRGSSAIFPINAGK